MQPTNTLYQSLQTAYQHFNHALFDNRLPEVMFTVQRQKNMLGYFAPDRWSSPEGERCHEISINPSNMGQSRIIEVMQTLVHEMVHCWQYCYGDPGRSCYHNKEWAYKMKAIGLEPSSTGAPGGKITGQHMSDYPAEGGAFLDACFSLVHSQAFQLPWIDRWSFAYLDSEAAEEAAVLTLTAPPIQDLVTATPENLAPENLAPENLVPESYLHYTYRDLLPEDTFVTPPERRNSKVKYQCPSCYVNAWGKPGIRLLCGDCKMPLESVDDRFV